MAIWLKTEFLWDMIPCNWRRKQNVSRNVAKPLPSYAASYPGST